MLDDRASSAASTSDRVGGDRSGRPWLTTDHRDLVHAAEDARDAMGRYAELLVLWNEPDDEHTRLQLRSVVESVLEEVGLRV